MVRPTSPVVLRSPSRGTSAIPVPSTEPLKEPLPAERISTTLANWWRNLTHWGKEKKGDYFSMNEMPTVSSNFPCPNNKHTIRSVYYPHAPINGSKIHFGERIYQIGQSPFVKPDATTAAQLETYMNAISVGLESGQGLVQIVSDKTHKRPNSSKTIAGMLSAKLAESNHSKPIMRLWANCKLHYSNELINIQEVTPKEGLADGLFKQYILTLQVRNIIGGNGGYRKFQMPLTQIGLPFEGGTLKADDIKRANEIVATHHENLRKRVYPPGKTNPTRLPESEIIDNQGPLILSKFGHGRSATVVTYQAVLKRIHDGKIWTENELLQALMEVIETGRAARPHFVHSRAQVEELFNVLIEEMKKFVYRENNPLSDINPGPHRRAYAFRRAQYLMEHPETESGEWSEGWEPLRKFALRAR